MKGILTEINSKDGSVVEVGALLGSVSEIGSTGTVKKEEAKKEKPIQKEDNGRYLGATPGVLIRGPQSAP